MMNSNKVDNQLFVYNPWQKTSPQNGLFNHDCVLLVQLKWEIVGGNSEIWKVLGLEVQNLKK